MTAEAYDLQRISRMLRNDLYLSFNGNACYNKIFVLNFKKLPKISLGMGNQVPQ